MRVEAAAHAKARAIVTILIGLRPGNNTDVLEALGLIPTVRALLPAPPIVDFTCQDCDWVPTKLVNPAVALASHRRARHRSVVSW
jgi:hypothetical protein